MTTDVETALRLYKSGILEVAAECYGFKRVSMPPGELQKNVVCVRERSGVAEVGFSAAFYDTKESVYGQTDCTNQSTTTHANSNVQSNPSVLQQQLQQNQGQSPMVSQSSAGQYIAREQQQQSVPQIYYSQQYQQQAQYGQNYQVAPRPIQSQSVQNYFNQANMPQARMQYAMQQQQQPNLAFQQPSGGENSASTSTSYSAVQRTAYQTHVGGYESHQMQPNNDADQAPGPGQMIVTASDMNVCHQPNPYRSVPLYQNYPQQQQAQSMYNDVGSR
ncbi:unnamed protein product [Soboliphyme baturini]|uniref:Calcium-responsive transactivator n=1 Tax=Soboliphyme baturini TaxID=241478 RepID=A0A183IXT1_9BILA|nr:unnamed protein product [Soboliphyme baturini]